MKRFTQFTFIIALSMLLFSSCTKEKGNSARRAGNKSNMVGTYQGTIYYTIHYSADSTLGLPDQIGTEDDFILKIEESTVNETDLKMSYIFTSGDTTVFYLSNLTDEGDYYFNVPNQLNEEGVHVKGNECYTISSTKYDGQYINSGGVLRFCTKAENSTAGYEKAYITTEEVYTKQ